MIGLEEARAKAAYAAALLASAMERDIDETRRTGFLRTARKKLREADRELAQIVKIRKLRS